MPQRIAMTVPLLRVWIWTLPVGIYSACALLKSYPPFNSIPEIPSGIDAALSLAMALLIAFRVNRAYERWWEARTLWGQLVNVSRNLAVKTRELLSLEPEDRKLVRDLMVAYCAALRNHLRNQPNADVLSEIQFDDASPRHVPSFIVRKLYASFRQWRDHGKLNDQQLWILDTEARELLNICGGCERIKNTLISVSWRRFTWQCILLYLLVFPWGVVDDFGIWTVPLTMVVTYLVTAGEVIAHFIEAPFGPQEDHLDLAGICNVIEQSVSEVLGG